MASTAPPQVSSGTGSAEPDSVDIELGNGEFSESTLERVRDFPRPSWYRAPSPAPPLDDGDAVDMVDELVAYGAPLPPPAYEAAVQRVKAIELAAARVKNIEVDPSTQAEVEYRRRLVEGASMEDRKWLKLRAYHRAQQLRRAEEAKLKATEQQLQEAEQLLLQQQQQQQLEQQQQQQAAAKSNKKGGTTAMSHISSAASSAAAATPADAGAASSAAGATPPAHPFTVRQLQPVEYSEDSEWAPDWRSSSYLQIHPAARALLQQQQMHAAHAAAASGGDGSSSIWHTPGLDPDSSSLGMLQSDAQGAVGAGTQTFSQHSIAGIGSIPEVYANGIVRGYTPAYLQEQQLTSQLRRQKLERKLSFWLAFGAVTSIALLKALRHRLRKQRKAKSAEDVGGDAALTGTASGALSSAGGSQAQLPTPRVSAGGARQGSLTASSRRTAV